MNKTLRISSLVLLSWAIQQTAAAQDEAIIEAALRPLPEDLRANAAVVTYDEQTGERIVLRAGNNQVECQPPNAETGFTRCASAADAPRRDLSAKLSAEGLSGADLADALAQAEADGRIPPATFGSMRYRVYDNDDRIKYLWVVSLPNAMPEELGMSLAAQRDSSLAGQGLPWMMREGTPSAHLMIPINGTPLSNPGDTDFRLDTAAIDDPVEQATLPLPEDLRAGAAVVRYDTSTGERHVLREGTNFIECQPRNPDNGFTVCYNESDAPEQALRAKLAAEGKSGAEIGDAIAAAAESGEINRAPFGSMIYRLYEEDDRLKLLWVMRLPNATPDQLGMPTGSQRDASLAGQGLPWMMAEGTPQAHLMIPINSTPLSN